MRKILPSILILLILVNLFAPVGVGLDENNKLSIKKSVAEAAIMDVKVFQTGATDTVIDLEFNIHRETSVYHGIWFAITDAPGTTPPGTTLQKQVKIGQNNYRTLDGLVTGHNAMIYLKSADDVFLAGNGAKILFGQKIDNDVLTSPPETTGTDGKTYKDTVKKQYLTNLSPDKTYWLSMWAFNGDSVPEGISFFLDKPIKTTVTGSPRDDTKVEVGTVNTTGPESALPACWLGITEGISVSGCIAQLIYYLLFVPTSFLFALTGTFFDWTFHYTIQDSSYSSGFVVEGWGIVRDFCNIFFIFVLLYIAFRTILGLGGGHGPNTKQMIINVVIIGLLINFSLFAAQVIIDSSNILARVFYNSNSIKITKNGANGVTNSTPQLDVGPNGELPLSAALVNKVNPQNLIIDAKKVGNIKDEAGKSNQTVQANTGVSNGTFILVTLLAIIVNVVGMIVFFSVGIMCIARVIGLWLYMIFAPLAFFSYTVPQMQGLKMIGWKNWWSQLLCFSFWAPLFIFFLYLILKFLETGFDLIGTQDKEGLQFVIAIVVPFAFIMMLLWKAKNLANSMGCEIAGQITGGIAAIGGIALGGAALGAAALGRSTIGATSKYIQNDAARKKDAETFGGYRKWSLGKKLNPFAYVKQAGKTVVAGVATGIHAIPAGKDSTGKSRSLGQKMQDSDKAFGKKQSSQNTLDSKADHDFGGKGKYEKGVKYNDLTETEQLEVKKSIDKDLLAKQTFGTNFEGIKEDRNRQAVNDAVNNAYTTYEAADKSDDAKQARAEAKLKTDMGIGKDSANDLSKYASANQVIGEFVSALRKGSMDIRNLSQTKSSSKGFAKFGVGLLAAVAAGTRLGFKQSGINHGTGQKDFMKDLGNTITEALKGMKVDVKVDKGGHGEGKASDGGHH